jgi:hypothetical protein
MQRMRVNQLGSQKVPCSQRHNKPPMPAHIGPVL